jgi:all-trans-8'-apo-beta-carotenal 15,15'-oxygenase
VEAHTEQRDRALAWAPAFESMSATTPEEVELEVSGTLPPGLAGTLYRVGPARFEGVGERYGHWFDGDAAVHALRFGDGRVHYRSAWVDSAATREEQAAGQRLWGGAFWTPPAGSVLQRRRRVRKNVPNINVVPSGDRLLALSEGGLPVALDRHTLATIGEDDLGGILQPGDGFSAHPKVDPATREVWNFGVRYGASTELRTYRSDATGRWQQHSSTRLMRGHMVHDMALTDRSVVITLVPFVLPRVPVGLLAGRVGFGQALRWEPGLRTTVLAIDRSSAEVRRFRTDALFTFHVAGAHEDGDQIDLDLCTYPDAGIVRALSDIMRSPVQVPRASFERIALTAGGTSRRRTLTEVPLEFPRPRPDGRVLGLTASPTSILTDTPCAVDASGHATTARLEPGQVAGEPVQARDGSILTLVLDGARRRSELRVYPPDLGEPLAVVVLPHRVPLGLHGNFVPEPVPA